MEKMQAGVSGANDNTEWKWVWKYGANAESVAKNGAAPSSNLLRHKSATEPKCYGTKVVPPAWRSLGGTQKHGWRLEEHKRSSRRNGNGDSEEIQTVIREKYKHRRHGELGLDWEEMGGGGKLNIIEWEIYLGTEGGQKVSDNYFFPLSRFVFPSARKNEA